MSDFYKDRTSKDGLQHCCKDCTKIRNKERLQRNNELRRNRNNQPIMEGTKTCAICGRELPVDMFGIAKRESDGRRYECNDCRKKEREENGEYLKFYRKEYYKENKIEILEKQKAYNEENKDKIKERSKRFYQEHKAEISLAVPSTAEIIGMDSTGVKVFGYGYDGRIYDQWISFVDIEPIRKAVVL